MKKLQYSKEEMILGNENLKTLLNRFRKNEEKVAFNFDSNENCLLYWHLDSEIKSGVEGYRRKRFYALPDKEWARIFLPIERGFEGSVLPGDCTKEQAIANLESYIQEREKLIAEMS